LNVLEPSTVLKADPAYRRKVLVVYVAFVALCTLLVLVLQQWGFPAFDAYLRRQKPDEAIRLLKTIVIVSMSVPLGIFVYLFRLGRHIQLSAQFPAPGTRVIRDTEILRGRAAIRRGNLIVMCSVIGGLAAIGAAVVVSTFR
jgi:hypothetical protein